MRRRSMGSWRGRSAEGEWWGRRGADI